MQNSSIIPISVVIASYNAKQWVAETIASINKAERPAEILVIDDCSTDGSYEFVEALQATYANIRLLKMPANGGAAKARLHGLQYAAFPEFCFVDADDLLGPGALALAHAKLSDEVDVCLFDLWRFRDLDSAWRDGANLEQSEVSGPQAFELTLGGWNAHAFGVYKKQQFLEAYKQLDVDCFNADEILTRIIFRNSKRIAACAGRYYYRQNDQSITRGFNAKFPGVLRAHTWLVQHAVGIASARRRKVIKQAVKDCYQLCKQHSSYNSAWVQEEVKQFLHHFLATPQSLRVVLSNPKYLFYFLYALFMAKFHAF